MRVSNGLPNIANWFNKYKDINKEHLMVHTDKFGETFKTLILDQVNVIVLIKTH